MKKVKEKSSHIITCLYTHLIEWSLNGSPSLPKNIYKRENEFIITDVEKANEGTYRCKGYTEDNEMFVAESTLSVISK